MLLTWLNLLNNLYKFLDSYHWLYGTCQCQRVYGDSRVPLIRLTSSDSTRLYRPTKYKLHSTILGSLFCPCGVALFSFWFCPVHFIFFPMPCPALPCPALPRPPPHPHKSIRLDSPCFACLYTFFRLYIYSAPLRHKEQYISLFLPLKGREKECILSIFVACNFEISHTHTTQWMRIHTGLSLTLFSFLFHSSFICLIVKKRYCVVGECEFWFSYPFCLDFTNFWWALCGDGVGGRWDEWGGWKEERKKKKKKKK